MKIEVTQSCLTLCNPMDCSLQGSSVHWIFQARVLEWVSISFSRGSSWPRDQNQVSCIAGRHFTIWATWEDIVGILLLSNYLAFLYLFPHLQIMVQWYLNLSVGLPDGSVVKNPPANAGDMVQFLGWEDSTCCRATKLMLHNYWAYALELTCYKY